MAAEEIKRLEEDGVKIINALLKAPPKPPEGIPQAPAPPPPPLLSKPVERVNMITSDKEDLSQTFGPKPNAFGVYRWRIENFLPVPQQGTLLTKLFKPSLCR